MSGGTHQSKEKMIKEFAVQFLADEQGQDLIEYTLLGESLPRPLQRCPEMYTVE